MPTRSRTKSGLRSASRFVVAVVLVATTVAVIFVAGVEYRYLAICGVLGLMLGLLFVFCALSAVAASPLKNSLRRTNS